MFSNLRVKTARLQPVSRTICKPVPTATFLLPACQPLPSVFFFSPLGLALRALCSFSFLSHQVHALRTVAAFMHGRKGCVLFEGAGEGGTKRGAVLFPPHHHPCVAEGLPPQKPPVTCAEHSFGGGDGGVGGAGHTSGKEPRWSA